MAGISSHTQKFLTSLIDLHQDCVKECMIIYAIEPINKCITEIQEEPDMIIAEATFQRNFCHV